MRCSVVIATYNKGWALAKTLDAIRRQVVDFDYEVIVVDDGSTDATADICEEYGVEYIYLDRPYICGPSAAMNAGYKRASGDIIVCCNDDVVMQGTDCLQGLCDLPRGEYHVATWWSLDKDGVLDKEQIPISGEVPKGCFATPDVPRMPIFFLTSIWRRDIYGVGGRDEDFTKLNYEDVWFMYCLMKGRGLNPIYRPDCVGHHQWHERPLKHWGGEPMQEMRLLLHEKRGVALDTGRWASSGGPWSYKEK